MHVCLVIEPYAAEALKEVVRESVEGLGRPLTGLGPRRMFALAALLLLILVSILTMCLAAPRLARTQSGACASSPVES
jgi:hypothetical protein